MVICREGVWMAIPQTKRGITRGKQIIIMGRGIRVMEGISAGTGEPTMGL